MTERALELLRQQRLAKAAFTFNFDLRRARHCEEVLLASGASLEPIAGDDTGGTFFVCGGGPPGTRCAGQRCYGPRSTTAGTISRCCAAC